MGAWIEIDKVPHIQRLLLSLLSWERGLKSTLIVTKKRDRVAPLVGAWIEIRSLGQKELYVDLSLLSWERGLKSF